MTLRSLTLLLLVLISGGALAEGGRREEVRALRDTADLKQIRGGTQFGSDCFDTVWYTCDKKNTTKLCRFTRCTWHVLDEKNDTGYWWCKDLVTQKRIQDPGWKSCRGLPTMDKGWEKCNTDFDEIYCYWLIDCAGQKDDTGCDYVRRAKRRGWWCKEAGPEDEEGEHTWSEAAGKKCPVKKGS